MVARGSLKALAFGSTPTSRTNWFESCYWNQVLCYTSIMTKTQRLLIEETLSVLKTLEDDGNTTTTKDIWAVFNKHILGDEVLRCDLKTVIAVYESILELNDFEE